MLVLPPLLLQVLKLHCVQCAYLQQNPLLTIRRTIADSSSVHLRFSPIPPLQSPPPIPSTSTLLHPHAPTPPPPQQLPILPVPPQSQLPRLLLTTDIHYDQPTQTLIAMLEVPGVRSQDVQVTLSTSMYNCVRQVKVVGRSWPVLPQRGEGTGIPIQRERRFGEFSRIFPVHPLMSAGDIDAEIQNGVLTLRMKCGPPATSEDEKVIPIR
ncbi:hypothetical protein DL96DRAFT_1468712 [Flagelloscypha sp. PMI_526]|nr:hypothetical protein DL96DRAFT_1468712 [Flagelloscypha sp. PMI_526]